MCKNCSSCQGVAENSKLCLKGIDLNTVENECSEWFPEECPITGMTFSGLVIEGEGILTPVYSCSPYTSYTIPEYSEEDKCFYRKVYDEDEGCWAEECQHFLDLDELKEEAPKELFEEIKLFYNIKD